MREGAYDSRLLEASEGKCVVEHVVAVHPACSSLEAVGDIEGKVQVLGVDRGSKTVRGRVCDLNDLVDGLKPGDTGNGAKDLLLKFWSARVLENKQHHDLTVMIFMSLVTLLKIVGST